MYWDKKVPEVGYYNYRSQVIYIRQFGGIWYYDDDKTWNQLTKKIWKECKSRE